MGKRIRKKWDLPSEQGTALAVLALSFLLGGIAGCVLAALADGPGGEELSAYLSDYLALAGEGRLPRSLWSVLWGQLRVLLLALILGITALGVVGLPLTLGTRGFFFAFSSACFCRVFGARGLFPAFALLGLPALLWVPALFLAGVQGFSSARTLLRRGLGDSRGGMPWSGPYWCRAGLCVGLALGAGALEYWVAPVLLRAAAQLVL